MFLHDGVDDRLTGLSVCHIEHHALHARRTDLVRPLLGGGRADHENSLRLERRGNGRAQPASGSSDESDWVAA